MLTGEDHVERDGEDSADDQHLQHEVVEGLLEDEAEGLSFDSWTHVVSEVRCAVWEVSRGEALCDVDLKKSRECLAT